MNEPVDEMELERYLQRRDPLSRAYDELRDEMPSDRVNHAVLQAARAATSSDTRPRNPWNAFWLRRAALAATLVLCVAVVLQINSNKQGDLLPATVTDKKDAAPEPYSVRLISPDQDAPKAANETAAPAAQAPQVGGGTSQARMQRPETPAPAAAPPPARTDGFVEDEREISTETKAEADAQAPTAEAQPSTAETGARAMQVPRDRLESARPVEEPRTLGRASNALSKASRSDADAMVRDPAEWLKEIEALRAAGRTEDADREMKRFLEVYPNYLETRTVPPAK